MRREYEKNIESKGFVLVELARMKEYVYKRIDGKETSAVIRYEDLTKYFQPITMRQMALSSIKKPNSELFYKFVSCSMNREEFEARVGWI